MQKNVQGMPLISLVRNALSDSELAAFFQQNKIKLVQAGAKLDNLPKGRAARLDAISHFDDRAMKVFKAHFRNVLAEPEMPGLDVLVESFDQQLGSKENIEPEQFRKLAKRLLYYSLGDAVPAEIVSRLSRESGASPTTDGNWDGVERRRGNENNIEAQTAEFTEIAYIVLRSEQPGEPIGLSDVALHFADALKALQKRDLLRARLCQSKIPNSNPRYGALEDAIELVMSGLASAKKIKGLSIELIENWASLEQVDPETVEILGVCSSPPSVSTAPAYIDVIAVSIAGKWISLEKDYLRKWIPDEGRIISFSDRKVAKPKPGEIGVWTIEFFATQNKIKYRLKSKSAGVYEIFPLECSYLDHASIREQIGAFKSTHATKPIFRTVDGKLLRVPKDTNEFLASSFDEPLHGWTDLQVVDWKGRYLYIGVLPTPEFKLDCRDDDRVLPALLVQAAKTAGLELTKKDANVLVDAIAEFKGAADPQRVRSLALSLDKNLQHLQEVKELVQVVLMHPTVSASIETAKREAIESAKRERSELTESVAKLQEEKQGLERQNRERRIELQKIPSSLTRQIQMAFQKAKTDGVSTLSDVAVLSAFLGNGLSVGIPTRNAEIEQNIERVARFNSKNGAFDECLDLLSGVGNSASDSRHLLAAMKIVVSAGIILVLSGAGAASVARSFAAAFSRSGGLVKSVRPGDVENILELEEMETADRSWDTVLINNFNNSPPELYAASLLELMMSRVLLRETAPLAVVATYSEGLVGLPLSESVKKICAFIDLGSPIPVAISNDIQQWVHALQDDSQDNDAKAWPPTILALEKVLKQAANVDSKVLSILEKAIQPR